MEITYATLVCVYAPGLIIIAETLPAVFRWPFGPKPAASWIRSTMAPSWLDWKLSRVTPRADAWDSAVEMTSARVVEP